MSDSGSSTIEMTIDTKTAECPLATRIAEPAHRAPDALALAIPGESVSYGELHHRAGSIAGHLVSLGVRPDSVVGIFVEPSPMMAVAALGILEAGGAYLPLDPRWPADRIDFVLKDAGVALVITEKKTESRLPKGSWRLLNVEDGFGTSASHTSAAPGYASPARDNLAYVIYTSGSTGRPKGVQLTRGGLLNLIEWHIGAFGVTAADRASQLASPSFDAAVWEIWPYLISGASVHWPKSDDVRTSAVALRDWLLRERISIAFVSTILTEQLLVLPWPEKAPLRFVLTGADTLHQFPDASIPFTLVNNYGPTECTVVTTSGIVPAKQDLRDLPTIGKPIANVYVKILDENLAPVGHGEPGELYVGGASLARGYVNRPDLTAQSFIANPFAEVPGDRLYRTGDLVRVLENGELAFVGRKDRQVKIRGYRIELDEIAAVLGRCRGVQAAAVSVRNDAFNSKQLIAYLVAEPAARIEKSALQDFLRNFLPDYMIPAVFVRLAALPTASSGKIAYEQLPTPDAANTIHDHAVAPRTVVEQRLTGIVTKLLGVKQVGTADNFFLLGGHSLLGAQLISHIRSAFGVELPLRSVFELPTIAQLAEKIEQLVHAKIAAMSSEELQRALSTPEANRL